MTISALVVHASATFPSMDIGFKEIDSWHRERGFNMCGYHYIIRRDGTVEKGREDNVQGAHVGGFNRWKGKLTLGICLVGGLKQGTKIPQDNFTPEQYTSLSKLLDQLMDKYPEAKLMGHRNFPSHESRGCPCFDIESYIEYIYAVRTALYLPDNWADWDWKLGVPKDWNVPSSMYEEIPNDITGK